MSKAKDIINDNQRAACLLPREQFDDALIGLASDGRLIYSEDKILHVLQESGMSYEEALDHYATMTISSQAHGNRLAPIIATQTA